MPRCYLLTVCSGSSVDQYSNNATLFNLVEQLNVPPGAPPPPHRLIPLEAHAYFQLTPDEIARPFEIRFAMVAASGLETFGDVHAHKSMTVRYRTRTLGLPFPPVTGHYDLRVDWRYDGEHGFVREAIAWPLLIVEQSPRPAVTH